MKRDFWEDKRMNIQIFGTSKCFDTKKAQRYFKERGIRFQMMDLKEKEMSRGEFENVARALGGWQQLVDPAAKDKQTLALLDALVDWQKEDKLFENQQLFKTPIVATAAKPPWAISRMSGKRGNKTRFHKKSTPRILHFGAKRGILRPGMTDYSPI